jgi:integrase
MGGKVRIYQRPGSSYWQCAARFNGKNHRASTKEEGLAQAKEFAEDWYLTLCGKARIGELKNEKTFKHAAEQFEKEYDVITGGNRSTVYVTGHKLRLKNYLVPFFGELGLSEVTSGKVQEYRIFRQTNSVPRFRQNPDKQLAPPAPSTIHQEIVCLRQVLKTAMRYGWLTHLPDLSMPYKTAHKIRHRAWFSAEEYEQLYKATRQRAAEAKGKRYEWQTAQLHDMVLFIANTGVRPDEAYRLEYRDIAIVDDYDTEETILEIEVRGKRGVGFCKSMPGAVRPFERLVERNDPDPTDLVFPKTHLMLLNRILEESNLKFDRDGNRRTAYSLRHTYICLRLMEGADIYQIAKNCRTSVEMIEKYYAAHIKTSINAAAVNVRRPRRKPVSDKNDD